MALAGDVVLTRRRALRVLLTALIAAAGLVFSAQAARAAGTVKVAVERPATGPTTGPATEATKWATSNGAISITIDDGRLTLYAPGVGLDQVLHRIGAEAGFKVIIKGDLRTASPYGTMTRVPLERALRRLFDGTSMVIVYEPPREDGVVRIAEVYFRGPPPPEPDARP